MLNIDINSEVKQLQRTWQRSILGPWLFWFLYFKNIGWTVWTLFWNKKLNIFYHTVYLHHTTNLYYRKSTIWPFEVSFESGEFETNFSRYDIELIYRQHFMRNLAILNIAWSKIWLIINITFVCKLQSPFYANCSVSDVKIIIFASHTCSKKYQGRFRSHMSTSKSTD